MKRGWNNQTSGSSSAEPSDQSWIQMPSHPYASAYSSMTNPFNDGTNYDSLIDHQEKKARISLGMDGGSEGSEMDDEDLEDEDDEGDSRPGDAASGSRGKGSKGQKGDKPKVKLTRGSRACIACRKIKMRCIPDENGGPCKRCRSGGHECVFEESNRGKRSTRKNEALTLRASKMEAALKGIGKALAELDRHALHTFTSSLHNVVTQPEIMTVITNHAAPSVAPILAGTSAQSSNRMDQPLRGEDSSHAHLTQPPLSPRLHSLPDNVLSPLGLLAEASLQNTSGRAGAGKGVIRPGHRPSPLSLGETRAMEAANGRSMSPASWQRATSDIRGEEEVEKTGRGVASHNYFKPGASNFTSIGLKDDRVPELLTIVTREDINELFEIFFLRMAPHVPMFNKEFHTPDLVLQRSQFLCTVICAISARYYNKRQDLHPKLSSYAKRLAFEVPSRGYKSVEVVQAYLLLSLWTLGPEKTFEQDRTWMMLGMAIRMATDLNLHRKSITSGLDTEEGRARDLEVINRERCWLHCFVLDRSISAQMGKPYTLREDFIIRNACETSWYQQRFCLPSDKALSAYVVLQQIMSRAIDSIYSSTTTISGLRQDCDYMMIVRSAHEELRRWITECNRPDPALGQDYGPRAQFYYAYDSLVLYSFGLENAVERAKMDISFFLTNVYEAAVRVCNVVKEEFLPRGFLPYLPDTNFVMCSYALLSLLKLLKPELRPFHDSEEAIFTLVSEMADILEGCAVDPSHQPAIYAAFIREIVRKTKEARVASPSVGPTGFASAENGTEVSETNLTTPVVNGIYDPQLLGEAGSASWVSGEMMNGSEGPQFAFIPQGGDMMILPSNAGPSQSIQNSPNTNMGFTPFPGNSGTTPQAGSSSGWAEYLPTFLSSEGFDGWDGSMLLPGFGRDQITLSGGLLHSQYGSGIMTPAHETPAQSRIGSRAGTPTPGPPTRPM